jgi:DNA-binding CsgD family transcriptional regulator
MTQANPLTNSDLLVRLREMLAVLLDALPPPTESSGTWNLVDEFNHRGERYMVVRRSEVLSVREAEVLSRAAEGETNKEIAYALGLAYSTVRVLLHRAGRKLGVRSRAETIRHFASRRSQP